MIRSRGRGTGVRPRQGYPCHRIRSRQPNFSRVCGGAGDRRRRWPRRWARRRDRRRRRRRGRAGSGRDPDRSAGDARSYHTAAAPGCHQPRAAGGSGRVRRSTAAARRGRQPHAAAQRGLWCRRGHWRPRGDEFPRDRRRLRDQRAACHRRGAPGRRARPRLALQRPRGALDRVRGSAQRRLRRLGCAQRRRAGGRCGRLRIHFRELREGRRRLGVGPRVAAQRRDPGGPRADRRRREPGRLGRRARQPRRRGRGPAHHRGAADAIGDLHRGRRVRAVVQQPRADSSRTSSSAAGIPARASASSGRSASTWSSRRSLPRRGGSRCRRERS